ncbi:hypothetical protein ACLOJK_027592 [Asimina triloba]
MIITRSQQKSVAVEGVLVWEIIVRNSKTQLLQSVGFVGFGWWFSCKILDEIEFVNSLVLEVGFAFGFVVMVLGRIRCLTEWC